MIWLSYDRAWGGSFETIYKPQFIDNWAISESELQPIKFQGQSLDVETGLHYNRFRYYDSDVGMFISRDPIGLLGGSNVFQYAPNPIGWIDPVGLSRKTTSFTDSTGFTLEVHGYTDLSHYSDSDLKSLHYLNSPDNPRPFGKSPVDRKGNTIVLHHYRQQDMGPIIGMPARQHQSNSKNLHPLGNKGGISNREQFNNWKREFWHNQAAEELKRRGITPSCT